MIVFVTVFYVLFGLGTAVYVSEKHDKLSAFLSFVYWPVFMGYMLMYRLDGLKK